MLNFLTTNGSLISYFKGIHICGYTASVLGFEYSSEGWPKALQSVALILYTDKSPDDLISKEDPVYSKSYTLKGRLYSPHISQYDSIVRYSRDDKESKLFKDLFQLF